MPRVTVLPHPQACPAGASFEARPGTSLIEALLRNGVRLEHACEMACACSTCHVLVRRGAEALDPAGDEESDQLDRAWGVEAASRLSCQVFVRGQDLTVELPRYTCNHAAGS
jgi:2Fe-2S ferredoxin